MVTCNRSCAAGTKNHNNYEDLHTHTGTEGSLITGWDVIPLRPLLPDISIFHIRPPPPFVEIVPRAPPPPRLLVSRCHSCLDTPDRYTDMALAFATDARKRCWAIHRLHRYALQGSPVGRKRHMCILQQTTYKSLGWPQHTPFDGQ